jgi:hypothetical protein
MTARLRIAAFFKDRLDARAAAIAACVEEQDWGNLTVSPEAPSLHGQKARP